MPVNDPGSTGLNMQSIVQIESIDVGLHTGVQLNLLFKNGSQVKVKIPWEVYIRELASEMPHEVTASASTYLEVAMRERDQFAAQADQLRDLADLVRGQRDEAEARAEKAEAIIKAWESEVAP